MNISGKTFDYVIVGGGTAGLALASRLSEDPTVRVVVLEAGEANLHDPNILIPAQFGKTFGNPKVGNCYDWAFPTVKQEHSNGKEHIWSRGKGLGGSSGLNFCAWVKPPAADVDAIEKLGNPGWNWQEYLKYTRRSETFRPPAQELMDVYPHTFHKEVHGSAGPVQTTIPFIFHAVDLLFQQTLVNTGLKTVEDAYAGDINGTWIANANYDPQTWTRSYAATAYFLPVRERPNLTVLTEATVARVLFDDTTDGQNLTATGVEFIHKESTYHVNAAHEVILSAGTIQSPQILELSGIGRPEILKDIGVELKLQLDGIGENVQDHTFIGVSFELAGSPETYDRMRDPEYQTEAMRLHGEGRGPQRAGIASFAYFPLAAATSEAPALIQRANEELTLSNETLPAGLQEQFDIQMACLKDGENGIDMEIVAFPGFFTPISLPEPQKSYISILAVLNHPFSRGSIHAKSSNPFDKPSIDPRYFEKDFDLEILVQHVKYVRTMLDTEPFKSGVVREIDPGPNCVTDEEIRDTVGSCSMLPKEKGGVVDPQLKVYGTNNLRVVDISIIPIHLATHTHATAYVIAEKAADIIRASLAKERENRG
ncbi:GMC oxidoreductase [Favolaschia claudopus]|uniref:GMC oxidoreductase n=1 Tax=Favolaschia claudopus TaxID=2862362 RepID=A0AAW0BSL0_9AGAR